MAGASLPDELLAFVIDNDLRMLKVLHDLGASMFSTDVGGRTLLHIAVLYEKVEIVEWVLSQPDLRSLIAIRDRAQRTPADDARISLNPVIIDMLGKYEVAADQGASLY